MRNIFGILIVAGFIAVLFTGFGADAIEVYTFKKDRVDQELDGNRGYISGEPEDMPAEKRDLKRTLIGVDIEIPSRFAGGGGEEETGAETPSKKEAKPAVKEKAKGREEWIK
jgi:hypothetical protein